jgi:bacillithiol system protein YtxJ
VTTLQPQQLDRVVEQSHLRPILIFKHSPSCGTSYVAWEEITQAQQDGVEVDVYIVDVLSERALSNTIAERFRLRHQSPQALLIESGQLRWSASHYGVNAGALARALNALERRSSVERVATA